MDYRHLGEDGTGPSDGGWSTDAYDQYAGTLHTLPCADLRHGWITGWCDQFRHIRADKTISRLQISRLFEVCEHQSIPISQHSALKADTSYLSIIPSSHKHATCLAVSRHGGGFNDCFTRGCRSESCSRLRYIRA